MGRTKLTQEQKDLIAVLPSAITKSETYQKLTDAQRLVLSQIDLQDGTDFSAENDYVFRSNQQLMKDTGISSEHTVIDAVRRLVNEGLITTKRGFRNKNGIKASEYVLTDKYYKLCERENPHTELQYMGCNNTELQYMGCNNTELQYMGCNNTELQYMGCNNQNVGCNKNSNCSTDIELDIEKDMNNIHDYSITCTGDKLEKTINDMKIDERLVTEEDREACEIFELSDDFDCSQYEDIARMVQSDASIRGVKKNEPSNFDKVNKWCSWAYNELEQLIQLIYDTWDERSMWNYHEEVMKIIEKVYRQYDNGWFTEKQVDKFEGIINNFNSIVTKKMDVFQRKNNHKKKPDKQTNNISNGYSDSVQMGGAAPKKRVADEDNEAILKQYLSEEELIGLGFEIENNNQNAEEYGQ